MTEGPWAALARYTISHDLMLLAKSASARLIEVQSRASRLAGESASGRASWRGVAGDAAVAGPWIGAVARKVICTCCTTFAPFNFLPSPRLVLALSLPTVTPLPNVFPSPLWPRASNLTTSIPCLPFLFLPTGPGLASFVAMVARAVSLVREPTSLLNPSQAMLTLSPGIQAVIERWQAIGDTRKWAFRFQHVAKRDSRRRPWPRQRLAATSQANP